MNRIWIAFKKVLHWIFILVVGVPILLYFHIFYIDRYARHPEKYPFEVRYAKVRKEVLIFMHIFRVDLDKERLNFINNDKKIAIIVNHQANLDPAILIAISEKPLCFVSKKEALKFPFMGKVIKALDGIFIDRHNIMNQLETVRQTVKQAKSDKYGNMVIYIEGTRNVNPENNVNEYKAGTIKTIMMSGVDIVPLAVYGTYRLLSLNYHLLHYPIYVRELTPITVEEYKGGNSVEIAQKLEHMTNEKIEEIRKLDISIINGSANTVLDKKVATLASYHKPLR